MIQEFPKKALYIFSDRFFKTRFFSRGASPPEPPSKESKQTSDNIACFYNLTLPIIKSVEIFNVILRLQI